MDGNGSVITGVLASDLLPVARASTAPKCATNAGGTPLSRKRGKSLDNDKLTQGVHQRVLNALYTSSAVAVKHSAVERAYYQKKLRGCAVFLQHLENPPGFQQTHKLDDEKISLDSFERHPCAVEVDPII